MRRVITILVATGALVATFAAPGSSEPNELGRVRALTARYHDEAAAIADGFVRTETCVEVSGLGGMGYHYINPSRVDMTLDLEQPELLLYAPGPNGRRQLIAVEYLRPDADQDLSTDGDRPTIFGQAFNGPMPGHEPGMPIHYDLHVWLWRANPAGTFAQWNQNVHC